MEKDYQLILDEYFAQRASPYEASPLDVYCSKNKNPDLEKIKHHKTTGVVH